MAKSIQLRAWTTWQYHCKEIKRLRYLTLRVTKSITMKHMVLSFRAWHEFMFTRQRQRQVVKKSIHRIEKREYLRGFLAWYSHLLQRRGEEKDKHDLETRLQRVCHRFSRSRSAKAFFTWTSRVSELQRLKAILSQVFGHQARQLLTFPIKPV